jgi:hypothetical protein
MIPAVISAMGAIISIISMSIIIIIIITFASCS